jgi:hypothetical protein
MELVRLLYRSTVATGIGLRDLRSILLAANENNAHSGITGMLVMHDDWFLQVLEGGPEAVNRCFMRIAADTRHHGVELLGFHPVHGRCFGQWKMKGLSTRTGGEGEMAELVRIHGDDRGQLPAPEDLGAAFALLRHAAAVTGDG